MLNRVPSEGDIRGLSPSLTDALLLGRLIRKLCARHRSDLAVTLGQGISGVSGDDGGSKEEKIAAAETELWVNDKLSDVRLVRRGGGGLIELMVF